MGQIVFANDYFSLNPDIVRVAKYFNYTAFRIAFTCLEISNFNYHCIPILSSAGVFPVDQNVEEKALVFRNHQARLPSCLIDADKGGGSSLEYLDHLGFRSAALLWSELEKGPVAMMGTAKIIRSNERILTQ